MYLIQLLIPGKSYKLFFNAVSLVLFTVQSTAQTDTLYVKKYRDNLVPRILTNYKNLSTNFITKSDTSYSADYFSTGGQSFIGIEIGYKWATLDYNFGFNKENSSTNTDLRLSTSFKPLRLQMNYTNLRNLNYYRVDGTEQKDTVFIARQHGISLRNAGIKVDYLFNHKNFSYSSSISQVGKQLISQGSFILSSGVSYQDFDLHGLSDSIGEKFFDRYHSDHFKTIKADIGFGYAYNWVLNKNFVISVSEIPNVGFQQITSSNSMSVNHHSTASITNYFRAGVIYTWHNFFIGMFAYNSITASKWMNYNYNNVYTSLQLHLGLVLDDPKHYFHK